MQVGLTRSKSLPFLWDSIQEHNLLPPREGFSELSQGHGHLVTANYFEWCPECVVLVNSFTREIVTANQAFQQLVAPISSIFRLNVLDALFPSHSRLGIAHAIDDVVSGRGHVVPVLSCATVVRANNALHWTEQHFDWLVKRHGPLVVLSGRLASAKQPGQQPPGEPAGEGSGTPSGRPLPSDTSPSQLSGDSAAACHPDACIPQQQYTPRAALHPPGPSLNDRNVTSSPAGRSDRHAKCFNRNEAARRIQEVRQFAELKAYGELLHQKGTFMQKIFHEIRTPCHTLQMMMKLMLDHAQEDPELRGQLETAWAQSVHICQLADDVKAALHLQMGQNPRLAKRWFRLDDHIQDVVGLVKKLFPKSAVDLQATCTPEMPTDLEVCCDRDVLGTVLRHLLVNAVKFTESGSALLEVVWEPAEEEKPAHITFVVSNPGPPLSPATVHQLGRPYWQGPQQTPASCGFGLGLHICFHYVQLLGGQLQVESTAAGTTFWFCVDADVAVGRPPSDPSSPQPGSLPFGLSGSQISFSAAPPPLSTSQESLNRAASRSFARDAADAASPAVAWPTPWDRFPPTPSSSGGRTDPGAAAPSGHPGRPKKAATRPKRSRWRCLLPWAQKASKHPESSSLEDLSAPLGHRPDAASSSGGPPPPPPPHVLVVEDNVICQRVVCKCLERVGFSYAVAQNGQVACDMVQANPTSYDVILMDVRMPVMDGIAATGHIRRQLQGKMPIIVFSAEVGDATLAQVAEAGATDFLAKPATPQMVLDMLRKHCPR